MFSSGYFTNSTVVGLQENYVNEVTRGVVFFGRMKPKPEIRLRSQAASMYDLFYDAL